MAIWDLRPKLGRGYRVFWRTLEAVKNCEIHGVATATLRALNGTIRLEMLNTERYWVDPVAGLAGHCRDINARTAD